MKYPLRIVCAAVRYPDGIVLAGPRHFDAIMQSQYAAIGIKFEEHEAECGFLDNEGDFWGRAVAWRIAKAAGQVVGPDKDLFSEDLY